LRQKKIAVNPFWAIDMTQIGLYGWASQREKRR
jgi:hypothetical protein